MSLKVTVNGTIGQIIHDLLLDELLDVEYYRDLEMWVKGHSRSLKMAPFDRPYATFYWSATVAALAMGAKGLKPPPRFFYKVMLCLNK